MHSDLNWDLQKTMLSYLGLEPPFTGHKLTVDPFCSTHEHISIFSQVSSDVEKAIKFRMTVRARDLDNAMLLQTGSMRGTGNSFICRKQELTNCKAGWGGGI